MFCYCYLVIQLNLCKTGTHSINNIWKYFGCLWGWDNCLSRWPAQSLHFLLFSWLSSVFLFWGYVRFKQSWDCFSVPLGQKSAVVDCTWSWTWPNAPCCVRLFYHTTSSLGARPSPFWAGTASSTTETWGPGEGLPGAINMKRTAKTVALHEMPSPFNFPEA